MAYEINYNDERFRDVEADKKKAISEVESVYSGMANQSDAYFQNQIDATKDWEKKQTQIQNQQTEFAIDKIEQDKAQAKKDYTKEQSGAYQDWQKQSDQYGANAEAMATQGMTNTGYSESSQVAMYNAYQNRVATARESYNLAIQDYNNAITEARLQNNATLAQIAHDALQQRLELALQGFQYKNQLLIEQSNKKLEVENQYYNRYQDVLAQINQENALAEQIRQYNESQAFKEKQLAEEKRQFNANLAEEQRQYNATLAYNKSKSSSSGGSTKKSSSGSSGNINWGNGPTSNATMNKQKEQAEPTGVSNRHGESWVEIPGHGRFSWTEVYAYVKDGTIKESVSGGKLKYTWVGKKQTAKNVTPDAKGYAAKQKNLFGL